MTQFSAQPPCEASELVHFRHRVGEEGIELILKESIRVNDEDENHHRGRGRRPQTVHIRSARNIDVSVNVPE